MFLATSLTSPRVLVSVQALVKHNSDCTLLLPTPPLPAITVPCRGAPLILFDSEVPPSILARSLTYGDAAGQAFADPVREGC